MEHCSECKKEEIPCPYKDAVGCKETMLREKLQQHKEEKCLAHLDGSMEKIIELQEIMKKQAKTIKETTQKAEERYQELLQALFVISSTPFTVTMKRQLQEELPFHCNFECVWISSKFFSFKILSQSCSKDYTCFW